MKLHLPNTVKRIDKEDKIIFFNPDVPSWVVTDRNGAAILKLCNGTFTIEELKSMFKEEYGEAAEQMVSRFISLCVKSRLFDVPKSTEVPITRSLGHLKIVQFSISDACNLKCRYCYATDRQEHRFPKMSLADYCRVIDELCEISNDVRFSLTGGEPLLNPDCIAIARYIKDKGRSVDLLTNATLITAEMVPSIRAVFEKVTISMDGSNRELHEYFRGANTYERTEAAISMLQQAGVETHLSMTVNRLNMHDVSAMAQKYGSILSFAPLFPAGRANEQKVDLSISGKEYYDVLKNAQGINPLSYCESSYDNAQKCRNCKCAVGDYELSFSPTGDVYPCQLLHYPEFYIGNIHEHSVRNLYQNSPVIERCRSLTVDNIAGCAECFLKYVCGGACRARAFHECGDITQSGKFCEYEKSAYVDGLLSLYSHNLFDKE